MPAQSDILRALTPLRVVVLTENPTRDHPAILKAIMRAFTGGSASDDHNDAYMAVGEDLGVTVANAVFGGAGASAARNIVADAQKEALHTLVVPILYQAPNPEFVQFLRFLDDQADNDLVRPGLSLLPIESVRGLWPGDIQGLDYSTLDETALRPGFAAGHVLACACRILSATIDPLRIFISHAKLDGLPLAQSFRDHLGRFHGAAKFYDADDIPAGSNWKKVLQRGVEQSVLLVMRTNVYDERPWCVQELSWAEDFGCPVVVVEARTRLVRPREFLPVSGVPSVSVQDCNMVRVLMAGLREALRVRLFTRQIDELAALHLVDRTRTLVVPRTTLSTLGVRCELQSKATATISHVFIPEPFREASRAVAEKLVGAYFPHAWLGLPKDLLAGTV